MKTIVTEKINTERGSVCFIDVLGWKGIWQQNTTAIDTLHSLVEMTKEKAEEISQEYADEKEFRGKSEITKVLSISDTIALFTSGATEKAIEVQARICAWLLEYALKQEIPLRGAICYGEYSVKDNIMLGYAVDEAASWHETTDWIGVILTPSACFKVNEQHINSICAYQAIPFKKAEKNLTLCVDWSFSSMDELMRIIIKKGPHIPEIAPKYLNTLAFLKRDQRRS